MKTRYKILIIGVALLLPLQLVYSLPQLEPEPEQAFDYATCGKGTSYQEGICIDNNPKPVIGECWGGPACIHDELS